MQFMTINQTSKVLGLPHTCIRALVKANKCPGFYAGTRFYVDVDMFREQLEGMSRQNSSISEKP